MVSITITEVPKTRYKCPVCDIGFKNEKNFEAVIVSVNGNNFLYHLGCFYGSYSKTIEDLSQEFDEGLQFEEEDEFTEGYDGIEIISE